MMSKDKKDKKDHLLDDEPSEELEEELEHHPDDKDLKISIGSDESMDASDPSSATQPGGGGADEPHPSSNAPRK